MSQCQTLPVNPRWLNKPSAKWCGLQTSAQFARELKTKQPKLFLEAPNPWICRKGAPGSQKSTDQCTSSPNCIYLHFFHTCPAKNSNCYEKAHGPSIISMLPLVDHEGPLRFVDPINSSCDLCAYLPCMWLCQTFTPLHMSSYSVGRMTCTTVCRFLKDLYNDGWPTFYITH